MSKPFGALAGFLLVIILISVVYRQYNPASDGVQVSIIVDLNYGKSNVVFQSSSNNSSGRSTIIGGVVKANYTSIEGPISSASGTFNLLFDGIIKKTAQIGIDGGVITFDSGEIEEWDSGKNTQHTLSFQLKNDNVTIWLPGGLFESKSIAPNNRSFSVSVLAPVIGPNSVMITIDHTKIDRPLTDFPLMIRLQSDSPVLRALNWTSRKRFEVTQFDQQLYVEIESWNTTGAILWVKVPTISATVDTVLILTFNTSMTENIGYVGDTLDPTTPIVWSNGYVGVFHLNGNAYDSSNARNHGIVEGGVTWETGPLGTLYPRFDGTSGVIVVPDNPGYSSVNNGDKLTEEWWVSLERVNWQGYISPLGKGRIYEHETKWNLDGGPDGAWKFYILNAAGSYGSGARSSPAEPPHMAPTRVAGEWYMLHGQVIGNKIAIYEGPGIPGQGIHGVGGDIDAAQGWNDYTKGDGVPDGAHINPSDTSSPFYIGRYGGYDPEWQSQNTVPLSIYEVRLSSVNRSIAWMKADYFNQLNQLVTLR